MNKKELEALEIKWKLIGLTCCLFVLFLTMFFYETNIIPLERADALDGYLELWYKACELNEFEDLEYYEANTYRVWDCSTKKKVIE